MNHEMIAAPPYYPALEGGLPMNKLFLERLVTGEIDADSSELTAQLLRVAFAYGGGSEFTVPDNTLPGERLTPFSISDLFEGKPKRLFGVVPDVLVPGVISPEEEEGLEKLIRGVGRSLTDDQFNARIDATGYKGRIILAFGVRINIWPEATIKSIDDDGRVCYEGLVYPTLWSFLPGGGGVYWVNWQSLEKDENYQEFWVLGREIQKKLLSGKPWF